MDIQNLKKIQLGEDVIFELTLWCINLQAASDKYFQK